ncbi:MAG TPA: GFA family protein [Caulobacteraceae bacterium]|nr:GFA family protein [Caulobacteraceae bacterium]
MKVEGACHCGAIAYEAEVEPGTIGVCHCGDCQTLTGSAFRANIQAPAATFRLLRGAPKRYVKTADSGARRVHAFCGDCGAPVFACALDNPPTYSLRVGPLKQRYDLGPPARQIWTRRRLSWVCALDDVPALDGQP